MYSDKEDGELSPTKVPTKSLPPDSRPRLEPRTCLAAGRCDAFPLIYATTHAVERESLPRLHDNPPTTFGQTTGPVPKIVNSVHEIVVVHVHCTVPVDI
jgi:hypothetical protein